MSPGIHMHNTFLHFHLNYNRLFYIPLNYSLTVLDFVCFAMHFYQLLLTLTVNKHESR